MTAILHPYEWLAISNFTLNNSTSNSTLVFTASSIVTLSMLFSFSILFILSTLSVLILSCVFCKKQPLKSRGCTYALLLIAFLLGAMLTAVRTLTQVFVPGYEQAIRCYGDLFLLMPLIVAIEALLLSRNIRIVVTLNINKLKNFLFGNVRVSELLKEQELQNKQKKLKILDLKKKRKSTFSEASVQTPRASEPISSSENSGQEASVDDESQSVAMGTDTALETDEVISNADDVAQYFESTSQVDKRALNRLRCLKIMTSYWLSFFIVISFTMLWFVFAILYTGISLGNDPNCHRVSPAIAFGCTIFLLLFSFIIFILDLLLQYKEILQCKLKYVFCGQDKFLFRLEFLFIALTILAMLINNLFVSYLPAYSMVINQFPYIYTIIIFGLAFANIASFGGFVVFVTLIWECNSCLKKRKKKTTSVSGTDQFLDTVMKDVKLQILFREFCVQEWSIENFLCYQDLMLWNKRMTLMNQSKLKTAVQLYDKFIKVGTSMEINISNQARDQVKQVIQKISQTMKLQQQQQNQSSEMKDQEQVTPVEMNQQTTPSIITPATPTSPSEPILIPSTLNTVTSKEEWNRLSMEVNEVFGLILKEVKMNLNDTLYRFTLSSQFKSHMDEIELKENIMK